MAATTTVPVNDVRATSLDTAGIGGHPAGLTTLFFTEFWERFSYYGMRAILILYMTAAVTAGGLGYDQTIAGPIYGYYTSSVYITGLIGGMVADRVLGLRRAVFIGGILIALGHFSIAFSTANVAFFFGGMILIALGTGLLKPNISGMVGSLYSESDARRDAGFSIFYMGINLGAFVAPLACGYLAQSDSFKGTLRNMGFDPVNSWHWGFGAAGVGMILGLIVYVITGRRRLAGIGLAPATTSAERTRVVLIALAGLAVLGFLFFVLGNLPPALQILSAVVGAAAILFFGLNVMRGLTSDERRRMSVLLILFFFAIFWYASFEQAGSNLSLFADRNTRLSFLGFDLESSYFQSLNPLFIIALAPIFSGLWVRLGDRQPSAPAKFSLGLVFTGLGFLVVALAASFIGGGFRVSPLWLTAVYFLHTVGELMISPVGLSTFTKLAPARLVGLMLGVWFTAAAIGNYLAGYLTRFFTESEGALVRLFGGVGVVVIAGGIVLAVLTPAIKRLMTRHEAQQEG